jgi:hypothetical protein
MIPAPAESQARASGRIGYSFGPRFFLLLFIGLVWLVPAFVDRRFAYAMLGWDLLLLLAWLMDLSFLPRPDKLQIKRVWPTPLSLSTKSEVQISAANSARSFLRIHALDYIPSSLRNEPGAVTLKVAAGGEESSS